MEVKKQIYDLVLLAIFQNKINKAVSEINKEVRTDATGVVTYTDASIVSNEFPKVQNFILKSAKYQDVVFYANYFNKSTGSIIYRFSSGIILDSSTETPQYKIVFASYNVKTSKVTFVEKVLA